MNAFPIDEVHEDDIPELSAFLHREAAGEDPSAELARALTLRMRWLLLDNPANSEGVPVGWVLRGGTREITGAMTCIPQRFAHRGQQVTALMSAKFFVNAEHRGGGLVIFRRYLKLGERFPLFATTAGVQSGALWEKFGGFPIGNSDHEWIGAVRLAPVVEEVVHRRRPFAAGLARRVAVLAPRGLASLRRLGPAIQLTELNNAAAAAAVPNPDADVRLTAVRDEAFLHWRHFSGPDAADRRVFRARDATGNECVAVAQMRRRGYRAQIRAMELLDLWGSLASIDLPGVLAALLRQFPGPFDIAVLRGLHAEHYSDLAKFGFRRRTFDTATAWCIDRNGLAPTRDWALAPGDSE